jgi:uncharacterized membrane protein
MKLGRFILFIAMLVPVSALAQAPCPSGTLANVLGTSCTIGNATFIFQSSFNGFHQFDDATNTLQTVFLTPDAVGFVPVVSGTQSGFRLIANFSETSAPVTQFFSSAVVTFSYDIQVNGNFQITSESGTLDGSATQNFIDNVSLFDEHCFINECAQVSSQLSFFAGSGFSNAPSSNIPLNTPALASTPDANGLGFTTELDAFAFNGDSVTLNSATFLYTIVPQVPLPPLAKLKYTEIQVPGAASTTVNGINNAGDLVGDFLDSAGIAHGFLQDKNGIHEIAVPNGSNTSPDSVNNQGDVVGSFQDAAGIFHAFLLRGGSFTTLDFPGASATFAFDINDHGVIIGVYEDSGGFPFHGFRMDQNGFVTIDDPNQLSGGLTEAFGINNQGDIAGFYEDQSFNSHGFLFTNNKFQEVIVPGGFQPSAAGINDAQNIVGTYADLSQFDHGFIGQGTKFRTVDFPGSAGTFPFHVNASGQIVGEYFDDAGNLHSFLAERQPDDGSQVEPQNSSHRSTPMHRCTSQTLLGHHKNMKNLHSCPLN